MTWLLISWIALLGADRVSLLGERGAFVLTPFLTITPLVFAAELWRRHRAGRPLALSRPARTLQILALVLVALTVASVFVSRETQTSAARVVLLIALISGTYAVVFGALDRHDFTAVLAKGARYGLAVFLAFDVLQVLAWIRLIPERIPVDMGLLRFDPYVYADVLPRLSGSVMDPNRGGLLLVLYAFLIARGDPDRRRAWRWVMLAGVLLVLTLSRSASLAALGALIVLLLGRSRLKMPPRLVLGASTVIAAAVLVLIVNPHLSSTVGNSLEPLVQRITLLEGSSQEHLQLLDRGMTTGTRSLGAAIHGIGFGSSYVALQDFFPGNRYGNFHSVYVAMFAEAGVFALVVLLLLIGVPLIRRGPYRPLAAAAALFGVFYGAASEPSFWLMLVLGWLTLPAYAGRAASSRHAPTATPTAMASTAPNSR